MKRSLRYLPLVCVALVSTWSGCTQPDVAPPLFEGVWPVPWGSVAPTAEAEPSVASSPPQLLAFSSHAMDDGRGGWWVLACPRHDEPDELMELQHRRADGVKLVAEISVVANSVFGLYTPLSTWTQLIWADADRVALWHRAREPSGPGASSTDVRWLTAERDDPALPSSLSAFVGDPLVFNDAVAIGQLVGDDAGAHITLLDRRIDDRRPLTELDPLVATNGYAASGVKAHGDRLYASHALTMTYTLPAGHPHGDPFDETARRVQVLAPAQPDGKAILREDLRLHRATLERALAFAQAWGTAFRFRGDPRNERQPAATDPDQRGLLVTGIADNGTPSDRCYVAFADTDGSVVLLSERPSGYPDACSDLVVLVDGYLSAHPAVPTRALPAAVDRHDRRGRRLWRRPLATLALQALRVALPDGAGQLNDGSIVSYIKRVRGIDGWHTAMVLSARAVDPSTSNLLWPTDGPDLCLAGPEDTPSTYWPDAQHGRTVAFVLDGWGLVVGTERGRCAALRPDDCDDGNPCTKNLCEPATGCTNPPFEDGTPCGPPGGEMRTCAGGSCGDE